MKNEEAKFILNGYRPGGGDAGDARFAEALRQSQVDPGLAAWFRRSQAHDAAVAAKLRQIGPPAGLRDAILAGARAGGAPRSEQSWWRAAWTGGVAAALVVGAIITAWWWPQDAQANTEALIAFAAADAAREHGGGSGAGTTALAALLGRAETPLGEGMPVDFTRLRADGCRTLRFAGKDVIEVCFERQGKWYHFYAVRSVDFPALREHEGLRLGQKTGTGFVAWSDDARRYYFIVASAEGEGAIRDLLVRRT